MTATDDRAPAPEDGNDEVEAADVAEATDAAETADTTEAAGTADAAETADAPETAETAAAANASDPAGEAATAAEGDAAALEAPRDRRARAQRILELLDQYVPAPAIPLDHGDPFQLLVAVLLSAQCTDARVNMVTPALFARAPDAPTMARLRSTQIKPYIRTCGLAASKARALSQLSRILVREHGGQVPKDLAMLETLPGVGHKTASVVLAQAFQEPAFPVDTHIHRLAGRWQLSRARTVEEVEHDLKQLFPRERWSTLHLQFIYFGRQHCTAKGHVPSACPICSWAMSKARALREERQGLSKPLTKPKPKPTPKPKLKATPEAKATPAPAPATRSRRPRTAVATVEPEPPSKRRRPRR